MKENNTLGGVLEIVQTLCLVAVTAAVIWFLWSIAPSIAMICAL